MEIIVQHHPHFQAIFNLWAKSRQQPGRRMPVIARPTISMFIGKNYTVSSAPNRGRAWRQDEGRGGILIVHLLHLKGPNLILQQARRRICYLGSRGGRSLSFVPQHHPVSGCLGWWVSQISSISGRVSLARETGLEMAASNNFFKLCLISCWQKWDLGL